MWSFSISVQSRCCIVLMSPPSIKQTNPSASDLNHQMATCRKTKITYSNCLFIYRSRLFTNESNFQHFTESRFTSILCREFPFMLEIRNFSKFT